MIWGTRVLKGAEDSEDDPTLALLVGGTAWPVHEVGRNADFFGLDSARLLQAGSRLVSDSIHLHSNGRDTKAHLEIGFKFMPKGFKPKYRRALDRRLATASISTSSARPRTSSCTPTRCCRRT